MEKLTDKITALPPGSRYFSLEFFPPKTLTGLSNLQARLTRMSIALRPLFVNVTWGAGGSTAHKSLELVDICQRQLGLTTCLHLTCTNMSKRLLDDTLEEAKALGVRNILALRGDPPREEEYGIEVNDTDDVDQTFTWAVDLVRYIKRKYGDVFCIGVAGYPEGHSDESHPVDQNPKKDLPSLVEKIEAGADFIMTQLFYDVETYLRWVEMVRTWDGGVLKKVPIIPGLMPIQSYQVLARTSKLSHARMPPHLLERIAAVKNDDEAVKRVGVDVLSEIIERIDQSRPLTDDPSDPRLRQGFHFFTLNLEKALSNLLDQCALIPAASINVKPSTTTTLPINIPQKSNNTPPSLANEPPLASPISQLSSSNPHNIPTVNFPPSPSSPTFPKSTSLPISEGLSPHSREATWDDYPNGRFGDARSPAYGEIDGYGSSSLHLPPASAREKWGHPIKRADISTLFARHVKGDLDILPWSEAGLNEETKTITKELLALIEEKGWWTVASQPAVDGLSSSDKIFGWGPKGGRVFQKPFVEFFMEEQEWEDVLRPHLLAKERRDKVSWYATGADPVGYECSAMAKGEIEAAEIAEAAQSRVANGHGVRNNSSQASLPLNSSPPPLNSSSSSFSFSNAAKTHQQDHHHQNHHHQQQQSDPEVNAVTWGAFPGKEIVTPTIIEEVSFRAWGEEAFGIWREWEACFGRERRRGGESRGFLAEVRKGLVLINVIGHEYKGGSNALVGNGGGEIGKTEAQDGESEVEIEDGNGLWRILMGAGR
ncbi:hypothetical protein MMC25_008286 [Agyrium rufum]|nr:hypothetical protein [Agyrium rufum]